MPTIHREEGFRFVIYVDDHEPAHVHVLYAGAMARIMIGDTNHRPVVTDPGSMRARDVRKAVRIVEVHQKRFLGAWREIHGT
ncbi:MAG: DUF4160 domain-containing protein [Gemmatimonas sp.]|nr:DUF4160 domain-containing protein [Gemmatimonas sp.]